MNDTKFTSEQVTKKPKTGRKFRTVITPERKYLCSVSNSKICDLNGREIATFSGREKRCVQSSEKSSVRVYESDYGEFVVKGNCLYLGNDYLGRISTRKFFPFLLFLIIFILLAAAFMTFLLIELPHDELPVVPVVHVEDVNGNWDTQETIAVFGDVIHPGSSGEYDFKIRNTNDFMFRYNFSIAECYNGEPLESFPLEYRVRVGDELVGSENWLPASELRIKNLMAKAQSECNVTLEWRWQFESGNDAVDTYFGDDGGRYTLELFLTAEAVK